MKKLIYSFSMALLVLSVVAANTAPAATAIGTAKARGDYSYSARSGGRSIRHARDYSRDFQTYVRQSPTMTPTIARQEAAGVGQNIAAAQGQFAELRKATTDKETLASLDAIDRQLVEAAKAHAKMHEMCKMEAIDAAGTMKCCEDVDAALAKAIAAHESLMKQLGSDAASPADSN